MTSGKGLGLSPATPRRVTAVDVVRDALRTAILRGDLPGDSRLVQTEIADQLGVSTTPVREAMRDLVSEGLITMDSHRIGTVRKPDWDEMVEIVEIRTALVEVAVGQAMANITEAELAAARALAEDMSQDEDLGSWVQKNIQFHSIFHQATKTNRLSSILSALEEAGGVFVAQAQQFDPEIRRRAIAEHFALLEAYEHKDVDRAIEIQRGHLHLPLEWFHLDSTAP